MIRVVKIREYILHYCILGALVLAYIKFDYIDSLINSINHTGDDFSVSLFLYGVILIQYLFPLYKRLLIKLREPTEKLKKISPYNRKGTIICVSIVALLHIIFWVCLCTGKPILIVYLVAGAYQYFSFLIERLYVDDKYFILSGKKYSFDKIEKVCNEYNTQLTLTIDKKEYTATCHTHKIKDELLRLIKEHQIEVAER